MIMKYLSPLFLPFFILMAAGCQVDTGYDFSRLDTTVTVLKGAEFPVPDTQFLLKDLFSLDDSGYISCDGNGNYLIRASLDPVDLKVCFPETDNDRIPFDFDPVQFEFGEVSDFLSGNDQTIALDLSDMEATLSIDSEVPAEFSFDMTIESVRSGVVSKRCTIDKLGVVHGSSRYVFLEETAPDDPAYYRAVPGLGKLFYPVPDALRIGSIAIYADAEQRAKVAPDQWFNLSFQVSAESPIRFSDGTRFRLSTSLGARLDLEEIGLKKAILSMEMENSIPLDFSFSLQALGLDGKPLDTIQMKPDFERIPALAKTNGSITLSTDGDLRFSDLVLELTASVPSTLDPSAYYGTCMNKNQGLKMTGMKLSLPDGIQVDLNTQNKP